ncbi:MAG: MarR family winged helix-turn-helix transcriptional regulator [Erythrobacter sp.]|jgi:DNA-binding MarR family transcriptional regulator|nr:MarR family winged helix-turn-helix transcriptional regulator [Erythrobacter sp.]
MTRDNRKRRGDGRAGRAPQLKSFLPYQLSIASNAVSRLIAERYRARFGLKITEWRVMAVLGDMGHQTQREIGETTLMDKVAVNRACKVLEERGLVARAAHERDKRSHRLELTREGQAVHAEILPLAREIERELIEGLSQEDEERLRELLARLYERARGLGEGLP